VDRLVKVLLEQRKTGGNLADLLDPLEESFLQQSGGDPAFYPMMRHQAEVLGAPIPERAR
jgi:hypothetical protein